jgi:hypothetical protein
VEWSEGFDCRLGFVQVRIYVRSEWARMGRSDMADALGRVRASPYPPQV